MMLHLEVQVRLRLALDVLSVFSGRQRSAYWTSKGEARSIAATTRPLWVLGQLAGGPNKRLSVGSLSIISLSSSCASYFRLKWHRVEVD